MRRLIILLAVGLWVLPSMADPTPLRLGLLKFGTVNWEMSTIQNHRLAETAYSTLEITNFAGTQAAKVALQAGAVDVIVADWVWVARQRGEGHELSFVPYSASVASLVVPADSPIKSIADLRDRKIGIAGGPLDKTWLLLQALAHRELNRSLKSVNEPVFGAPPLLNQQILSNRIDAVVNYWHYVVRLKQAGMHELIGADEILGRLGIASPPPLLGFVFKADWAKANPRVLQALVKASRIAKQLLCTDEAVWQEISSMTKAESPEVEKGLREGYCAGTPRRWDEQTRQDAARVFDLLKEIGGQDLVGSAQKLDPDTFWPGFDL